MGDFGKCAGGGRRAAARSAVPLPAVLTTLARSRCATVVDVSSTGARLRGTDLPAGGELLEVKIGAVRAFAIVVWSSSGQCGIAFDDPIAPPEIEPLQREVAAANFTGLTPEEREALEDWILCISH